MPTYLSPGVYVEEVPAGIQPLEGVGTSTGAFVGVADFASAALNEPVLVTNFSQYVENFGGFHDSAYLAYAVYSFFAEGGSRCYVTRVQGPTPVKASAVVRDSLDLLDAFTLSAIQEGDWGNRLSYNVSAATSGGDYFKLTLRYKKSFSGEFPSEGTYVTEVYDDLLVGSVATALNGVSALVTAVDGGTAVSTNRPADTTTLLYVDFTGGSDDVSGLTSTQLIGTESGRDGLHSFDTIDEINIVSIPDLQHIGTSSDYTLRRNAALDIIAYCEGRQDCFAILDTPPSLTPATGTLIEESAQVYKNGESGMQAMNSSYAALYYPWISVTSPATGTSISIPPSGAVIGSYAATDSRRGVHKAPAGTVDGYLNVAVGIERVITKGEQEILNPEGINVIRSLPSQGIVLWGARTLSAEAEWRYVNVRRLMMFIRESLDRGTQFVVFEPNDPRLWGRVRRTLNAFLSRVWRDGALFGATQEEAFFVKVDEENNPRAVRDAGQLIVEVGVAPVKPAEFVVIRISQNTQNA